MLQALKGTKRTLTKTMLSVAAAAAIGTAGVATTTTQANAYPVWVVPAIIGAAVVGVGTGAAIAANQNRPYAYASDADLNQPQRMGSVEVYPQGSCDFQRERINGRWRTVRVCD